MLKPAILTAAVLGAAAHLVAQAPDRIAFDVASVKPNKSGPTAPQRMTNLPAGERVSFANVTARNLIQVTYAGFSDIARDRPHRAADG